MDLSCRCTSWFEVPPCGRPAWPSVLLLLVGTAIPAAELLPPEKPIPDVIDSYIDAKLKSTKVTPAPQADDATLIRRLTLDLVGRIPTPAETRGVRRVDRPATSGRSWSTG